VSDGARAYPRWPILLGSLAMVAAGFLPWWRAGGELIEGVRVPPSAGIGLDGPGLVIYAAAILSLLLLNVGYIRGRWGFVLDAPPVYLVLGLAAAGALAWRAAELWSVGFLPVPQQSPGLAAALVGVALVLYGAGRGLTRPRA
jgi:hypothetical protein